MSNLYSLNEKEIPNLSDSEPIATVFRTRWRRLESHL